MRITRCDRCGEIVNPLYANDFYLQFGSIEYQLCSKCAVDMKREINEYQSRKYHDNKTDGETGGDSNVGPTY